MRSHTCFASKSACLLAVAGLLLCISTSAQQPASSRATATPSSPNGTAADVAKTYGSIPRGFEANLGQANDKVRFISHSAGETLLLEQGKAVLVLEGSKSSGKDQAPQPVLLGKVDVQFPGSNPVAQMEPLDLQSGKTNYLRGNDPTKWVTDVENFSRVEYKSLYPGVDLVFYGNQRAIEHDFIVSPGADYRQIALNVTGGKLRLDASGAVRVELPGDAGTVRFTAPKIYQKRNGQEVAVAGSYNLRRNKLTFKVGAYDKSLPLVIDPVLTYSTYIAGTGTETAAAFALDASGNAYVTGTTFSADFPTLNAFQPACAGGCSNSDVFVTKLNASGTALVYSTYLGGSSYDQPSSIAVDSSGNAIVGGVTQSTDFPVKNPFQSAEGFQQEGFLTSLSASGSSLNFSTYVTGDQGAFVDSVTTDSTGNVYVAGQTQSSDFPVTPATNVIGLGPVNFNDVLFIAKFTPAGAITFATTIGADPNYTFQPGYNAYYQIATGNGIAVDSNQNVYFGGKGDGGFLTTPGAFQGGYTGTAPGCGGCTQGVVGELKADGSALVYATYLGGSGGDQVMSLSLDAANNAYVTGDTSSLDFPVTTGAYQTTFPGSSQGYTCCESFVTKMNSTGTALLYSTFLGGPINGGSTNATAIAIDGSGDAYVTGYTYAPSFPLLNPIDGTLAVGQGTAPTTYITELNPTGSGLLFSTFLSGSNGTQSAGIAVSSSAPNEVYVAGTTYDTNFPTTPGAFQTSIPVPPPYNSSQHIFVSEINIGEPSAVVCTSPLQFFITASFNKASSPTPITLTNCGNAALKISHPVVTSGFTQTNTCAGSIAPGATCTINLIFHGAATPGITTGTLTVGSNAPIQPVVIQLEGETTAPQVYIYSNPLQLADLLVGQTGLPTPLIVTNQGDGLLNITGVTSSSAEFTATKKGCTGVQQYAACAIEVTFHPTAAGLQTATLTITDNAPDSPQTVTVEGNGLATYPTPTVVSVSPAGVLQNSTSPTITVFGTGFFETSVISVQGVALATKYTGETTLTAKVPLSMLKNLGQLSVQVTTPTPGGGVSNAVGLLVYQDFPIAANDLIYEPYTRQLYASISSTATTNPNTLITIDPETETLGTPVAIGSNPNRLGLSSDGTTMYVGLDGTGTVQQYKVATKKLGTNVSLASLGYGSITEASIQVVPGRNNDFVASVGGQYGGSLGVALVSNGALVSTLPNQPPLQVGTQSLCFLSNPKTFYGSNGQALYDITILNHTTLDVNLNSGMPQGLGSGFSCDSSLLYDFTGLVFNPLTSQVLGTYSLPYGQPATGMLPDTSVGQTYALTYFGSPAIYVFNQQTFQQTAMLELPENFSQATELARWGTDGFAYIAFNYTDNTSDVVLIRSGVALPSAGPNPVPAVTSASPAVTAGHANYQITVTGSDFVPGAVIEWNGSPRTTIYQSATALIADIPASDVSVAGTVHITVVNPAPSGGTSTKLNYVIATK
jgi:hypothetical protein